MFTHDAFLPLDRRLALVEGRALPPSCSGAAILADVSGFTALTAELAEALGPHGGAEALSGHLDRILTALIDEIRRARGSVIYFAGDAVMAWFENGTDRDAVHRAVACGGALQKTVDHHGEVVLGGGRTVRLALTVALAAGPARRFVVGAPRHLRIDVLAGPLLDTLEAVSEAARPGEVLVDGAAAAELPPAVVGAGRDTASGSTAHVVSPISWTGAGWPVVPLLDPDESVAWVVAPLRARLSGTHTELLATLRVAVPMFVRFQGIDYAGDPDAGALLDRFVSWVQEVLVPYEGLLLQMTTGDKGSNLQVVFGALHAHEDQLPRAIAAALVLQAPPSDLGFDPKPQIGISSGRLFVGTYGGRDRVAFTALGHHTNLAARLMSRAMPGEILVADHVATAVRDRVSLEDRGLATLKGHAEPLRLWAVTGLRHATPAGRHDTVIVGRDALLVDLARRIADQVRATVLLEAQAGMGKTRLVEALCDRVPAEAVFLRSGSDSIDQATPFGPWRPIVALLLGVPPGASADTVTAALRARLPERAGLAPLVGQLLGVGMPDTVALSQLTGRLRVDNTVDVIAELLAAATAREHHTLILEDLHWFDEASIVLLRRVVRDVDHLLVLATTRPVEADLRRRLDEVLAPDHAETRTLDALDRDGVRALLSHRLGVSTVPAALIEQVLDTARGHPYFSQVVVQALQDRGVVEVRGGDCVIVAGAERRAALEMPDTIEGVLIRRIDELAVDTQTVLKVASVIGPRVPVDLLAAIHPDMDRPTLDVHLATLAERGLLRMSDDGVLAFEHEILREVVYSSLLLQQRQRLHRIIALALDPGEGGPPEGGLARLAHHWSRAAGSPPTFDADAARPAVAYLSAAGDASLTASALEQAAQFFLEALDLGERLVDSGAAARETPDLARARLHLQLSKAYQGLGDLGRCQNHGNEALAQLGRPVPTSDLVMTGSVLWETLRRRLPRFLAPQRKPRGVQRRVSDLECDQYITLARTYYHTNATTRLLYSNAVKLRHAERDGPSPELAEAWAGVAFVLGLMNMIARSDALWTEAIAMAEAAGQQAMLVTVRVAHAAQLMGHGRLDEVQTSMARCREICDSLGDHDQWGDCVGMQADAHLLAHDVDLARQRYDDLTWRALRHNNHLHHLWALRGYAVMALRDGRPEDATPLLEHAMLLLERTVDQHTRIDIMGLRALSDLRQGRLAPAFEGAVATSALIAASGSPSAYGQYLGYGAAAEVFLALGDACEDLPPEAAARLPAARRQALRDLGKYSGVMRIGLPQTHRHRGRWLARRGRRRAAAAQWRRGLDVARGLGLAYEVEQLQRCLGDVATPKARSHAA